MRKNTLAGACVALVLSAGALLAPTAAFAATVDDGDNYTPGSQTAPTLTGSVVAADCYGDAPYISYDVVLTDPDGQATSDDASLFITDGSNSITLPLGKLQDNRLSGRVLWPGAAVEGGKATALPGWVKVDGVWKSAPDHFGWTRGNISAQLRVNPTLDVPLSANFMDVTCENPGVASTSAAQAEALAATGQNVFWAGLGLGAVAIGAGGFLIARRRRSAA